MSIASAPFGLRPIYHPSGVIRPTSLPGGLSSGYANNIFAGQPVQLTAAGLIKEIANNTDEFVGCFLGVNYTPTGGRPVIANFWPGGTAATDITVFYTDDPWIEYEVQTDGSTAFANTVGGGTGFTNITAGSTLTGLSAATAAAAVTTGSQQLRVLGLSGYPTNAWGDNFVILRVLIALHQYAGNKATI